MSESDKTCELYDVAATGVVPGRLILRLPSGHAVVNSRHASYLKEIGERLPHSNYYVLDPLPTARAILAASHGFDFPEDAANRYTGKAEPRAPRDPDSYDGVRKKWPSVDQVLAVIPNVRRDRNYGPHGRYVENGETIRSAIIIARLAKAFPGFSGAGLFERISKDIPE